jgi:hypothetical protein
MKRRILPDVSCHSGQMGDLGHIPIGVHLGEENSTCTIISTGEEVSLGG